MRRREGRGRLDALYERMVGESTALMTASVKLERAAANVPYLRRKRLQLIEAMLDAKDELATAKESAGKLDYHYVGSRS